MVHKLLFSVGCGLILISYSCAHWTINGIPAEKFQNSDINEFVEIAGGMISSVIVHATSHCIYLELIGADYKISGAREVILSDISDDQYRMFARAGFVGQLAVGTIIKLTPIETKYPDFSLGYHAGSFAEIISYPVRRSDHGDLKTLEDHGGNSFSEYAFYSVWASGLLITD